MITSEVIGNLKHKPLVGLLFLPIKNYLHTTDYYGDQCEWTNRLQDLVDFKK